jgi:hypothetical protein
VLLYDTGMLLLHELGPAFAALKESADPEARAFVQGILDRLHPTSARESTPDAT